MARRTSGPIIGQADIGARAGGRRGGGRAARVAMRQESKAAQVVRPGMEGGAFSPLNQRDMERIHGAALDILETVGIGDPTPELIDIALPFAIYRGDFFRVGDGGGPRGLFVDIPWLELNVGLDASFPVDSSDNDAREGMDDLDYLLEAGPKLIIKFLYDDPANDLDLSLAGRGVISTDFANVRYEGMTVNPAVTYRRHDLFGFDLRAIASLGAIFGALLCVMVLIMRCSSQFLALRALTA